MTIKHLLTHTSGLTYGFMNQHPVDALYRRADVNSGTLEQMAAKLAELPLKFSARHALELRPLHGRMRLSGGALRRPSAR